jgi:hypothetical protein
MWLGAAIYFSATVAPGAFAVLRTFQLFNAGEIAGAIVNRSLATINVSGFGAGLTLLLTSFLSFRKQTLRSFTLEALSLLTLTIATAVGQWVLAARLHALRLTLSIPIDQLPVGDPRRISFDSLHALSVKALGVAMIAALVGFIVIAYRSQMKAR